MSYDIDHIEVLSGKLTIKKRELDFLMDNREDELPEMCFLRDLSESYKAEPLEKDLPIKRMCWCGEFSGHAYEVFLEALSYTTGRMEMVLVWEGGDSMTGLKVVDGDVIKCKVKIVLEEDANDARE